MFVEDSAYTVEEARQIFRAAAAQGLRAKLHADQLTSGGGAELAAEVSAVSADHLECISDGGIRALAGSGVVAVGLPLASLYLNQPPLPARRLIEAGVPVAIATDFNPGSAPSFHLPFALTLACTLLRMTPAEALKGATINAARAVGLQHAVGSLEPGKQADFAVLDAPDLDQWLYHLQAERLRHDRRGRCSLLVINQWRNSACLRFTSDSRQQESSLGLAPHVWHRCYEVVPSGGRSGGLRGDGA